MNHLRIIHVNTKFHSHTNSHHPKETNTNFVRRKIQRLIILPNLDIFSQSNKSCLNLSQQHKIQHCRPTQTHRFTNFPPHSIAPSYKLTTTRKQTKSTLPYNQLMASNIHKKVFYKPTASQISYHIPMAPNIQKEVFHPTAELTPPLQAVSTSFSNTYEVFRYL